jgi:hypothetical protein
MNVLDTGSSTFDTTGLNENNKIYIEDASNVLDFDISDALFYIDNSISSCNASITSNNSSTTLANVGNSITVSFDTCEAIATGTVSIFGKTINATNIGGTNWSVSTTTKLEDTEGEVAFTINYTDLAGNSTSRSSTANGSFVIYDKTFPTATISLSTTTFTVGSTATATVTFNEKVLNFSNDDFTRIDNGTLSTATSTDGGITWTSIFTPGDSTTSLSSFILLSTSNLNDVAGNSGTSTATSSQYQIDTTRPFATTTLSANIVGLNQTFTLTITFNEQIRNFSNDDFTRIDNGTLSTATSTDGGITWTSVFTPTIGLTNLSGFIVIGTNYQDTFNNSPATGTETITYTVNTPVVSQGGGGGFSSGGGGGSTLTVLLTQSNTNTTNQLATSSVALNTAQVAVTQPQNIPTVLGVSLFLFSRNLKLQSTGQDVMELQKFLAKEGLFTKKPTKYFGQLTKNALIKWQKKNNLPATGYFGSMSRSIMNNNS